jgi:hypothetical protein
MKTHNEKRRLSVSSGETARMAAPLNEKGTEENGGGALRERRKERRRQKNLAHEEDAGRASTRG